MDLIIPKKLENKISQRILDALTAINRLDTVSVDISGDASDGYFTASINVLPKQQKMKTLTCYYYKLFCLERRRLKVLR